MKHFIISIFLIITLTNVESQSLEKTIEKFHIALQQKDIQYIDKHTSKDLIYLHSNAWIEDKPTLLNNLQTNYMKYQKFALDSVQIIKHNKTSIVKINANIQGIVNQKNFDIKLLILQTWKRKLFGRWKLIGRSATKIV
jgi:ketosteroid isomerase-like protein